MKIKTLKCNNCDFIGTNDIFKEFNKCIECGQDKFEEMDKDECIDCGKPMEDNKSPNAKDICLDCYDERLSYAEGVK